ncbi:winged helix-turn-helix domain-containing protein [Enterobacter cloacae]|uniref:transcriptional regulator n=1 Tax=Enterobacter cloacae TaxID=550 RepID=UPI0034A1DCE1
MSGYYLINHKVRFFHEKHLLQPQGTANAVSMFTPVSDCLLLLIENRPDVIPQAEMIQKIWGNKGNYISANSLYQTISLLRKAIRTAGIEEDVIVTIPKKGITLAKSVVIEYIQNGEGKPPPEEDSEEQLSVPTVTGKGKRNLRFPAKVLFLTLSLTLLITTIVRLLSPEYVRNSDDGTFFSDYVFFRSAGGCRYYSLPKYIKLQRPAIEAIVHEESTLCKSNGNVYINLSDINPGWTALKCTSKNDYCEVIFKKGH